MDNVKLFVLNHKKILIIPLIILFVILVVIYQNVLNEQDNVVLSNNEGMFIEKDPTQVLVYTKSEMILDSVEDEFISVDIKGRVRKPGVYRVNVNLDRRISDVIEMAGGVLNDADTRVTNLSKKLFDEMVIIIYSKEEVSKFNEVLEKEDLQNEVCQKECDSCLESDKDINNNQDNSLNNNDNSDNSDNLLININKASKEELMTLSGIGEAKAISIIEYREQTPFKTIEEIMNVSGIGESAYNKIKDYITV